MEGFIKLHRKLVEWQWYKVPDMVHLFIHLLLMANHKDGAWQGIKVQRGQVITGRKSLSENTGLSEQRIRTCIKRLKSTNEITSKSTSKYSVITICNYDKYNPEKTAVNQHNNQHNNQQSTNNQPAINQQSTTNKNDKNDKNDKNNTALSDFLKFWKIYDYDKNRDKCENIWSGLTNNDHKAILKKLPYYIHGQIDREQQFRKTPEKFLTGRVWEGVNDPGEAFDLHGVGYHMPRPKYRK